MGVLTGLGVSLSVQEPCGDVVVLGTGQDVLNGVDLLGSDFSGSLGEVDLGDLESQGGESSTDTSDLSEPEWSLLFTINICVLHSQHEGEIVGVLQYQ